MELLELWLQFKVQHAQIWQVGKSARICLELELWSMAKLVLKQNVTAQGPLFSIVTILKVLIKNIIFTRKNQSV